jgi:hypothetical protein
MWIMAIVSAPITRSTTSLGILSIEIDRCKASILRVDKPMKKLRQTAAGERKWMGSGVGKRMVRVWRLKVE